MKNNRIYLSYRVLLAVFITVICISSTLLSNTEVSDETWGYWLFARIFSETGQFIGIDRSPVYVLYLNLFLWLQYPLSIITEHIITSVIITCSIIAFARQFVSLGIAVLIACLWLTFIQASPPPVQGLAMASTLLAIAVRGQNNTSSRLTISYALIILSLFLRPSYVLLLLAMCSWDIIRICRENAFRSTVRSAITSPLLILFIVVTISFISWVNLMQSDSTWNNANFATSEWFPLTNPKSLGDAHFIQGMNWRYIEKTYGTFEGHDWYFTNKDLFDGAGDTLSAISNNPRFVFSQAIHNIIPVIHTISDLTLLRYFSPFIYIDAIVVLYIGVTAFKYVQNGTYRAFVIASGLILAGSVAVLPEITRHYVPLIPILILSAAWIGNKCVHIASNSSKNFRMTTYIISLSGVVLLTLLAITIVTINDSMTPRLLFVTLTGYVILITIFLVGKYSSTNANRRTRTIIHAWLILIPFVILSNGTTWRILVTDISNNLREQDIQILEDRSPVSMKASFAEINNLVEECDGIITHEHKFIGAFTGANLAKIHDIWEIPPFGKLNDPSYNRLDPSQINCVMVSHTLANSVGAGTNIQIRYANYIKPYIAELKNLGAMVHNVPNYGEVIILEK